MWNEVLQRLQNLVSDVGSHLPLVGIGLVVLLITWIVSRLLSRVLARAVGHSRMRRSHIDLLTKLISALIWVGGILSAATIALPGLTPAKLFTVLGVSSVAVGFAFKDVFENFLAGIVILMRNTFEIGQWVECEGHAGQVERISARDSLIRQVDGQLVILPNAMLFKNGLLIQTDRDSRRMQVTCGVDYATDLEHARTVLRESLTACETVHQDRPVEVLVLQFGDSSIDFEITWWCGSTPLEVRRSRDEVLRSIKSALDEAGIDIPFPQRVLALRQAADESPKSADEPS